VAQPFLHGANTRPYCGVFTPNKDCNFETRSRDYATVNEAVFSPVRAYPRRAAPRRASPCLLLTDNCKRLDRAAARRGHVTSAVSAVTSRNSRRAVFFRVSDRGFTGETELVLTVS
jgi:hypothetical protein